MDKSSLPVVSVVMIAYNKADYISDAIKGVVCQRTPFPIELIVMDDCSTDATGQIAKQWQNRYPEIVRYFRNPSNLGLQRNYIEGFRHVRGKYLAICDADDYWFYRGKLRKMVGYMDAHSDCTVAFHRVVNYYESTGEKTFSNGSTPADCDVRLLSTSNFITNLSVLYRADAVDLGNLPEWILEDRAPDYALHMLFASRGTIHFFRRPMGVYRKAAGSAWSLNDQFTRYRMSLKVRLNLMREFAGRPEIVDGLRSASSDIVRAMAAVASDESLKQEVREYAGILGCGIPEGRPSVAPVADPSQGILKRAYRLLFRLLPLPRP